MEIGLPRLPILLIVLGLLIAGCSTHPIEFPLIPTSATVPENDREVIVAKALRRAFIEEKDVPDYGLIRDPQRILVSNQMGGGRSWEPLTSGALPHSDTVKFILLSPRQIERLAFCMGDFVYVQVGRPEIKGDSAAVVVSTDWATSSRSQVIYLSGGAYKLVYLKKDGEWVFERVAWGVICSLGDELLLSLCGKPDNGIHSDLAPAFGQARR